MRVLLTPLAERQIDALHAFIFEHGGESRADAYVSRIVAFCLGLETFPHRGRMRDDILPGLRVIGFERRTTIAFVVTADIVLIEGLFHGGQDIEAAMRDRIQSANGSGS